MTDEISSEDLKAAVDRIARTADGELFYLYLQRVRLGVAPEGISSRALRELEGRRKFAADLMAFMAEGIRTSGRAGNRPVTFALAGARSARAEPDAESGKPGTRGAGRRVTRDTFVSGWDTPGGTDDPGRE